VITIGSMQRRVKVYLLQEGAEDVLPLGSANFVGGVPATLLSGAVPRLGGNPVDDLFTDAPATKRDRAKLRPAGDRDLRRAKEGGVEGPVFNVVQRRRCRARYRERFRRCRCRRPFSRRLRSAPQRCASGWPTWPSSRPGRGPGGRFKGSATAKAAGRDDEKARANPRNLKAWRARPAGQGLLPRPRV